MLVQKLRSQPQILTAYARDAPLRQPAAADKLVAALQQMQVRRRMHGGGGVHQQCVPAAHILAAAATSCVPLRRPVQPDALNQGAAVRIMQLCRQSSGRRVHGCWRWVKPGTMSAAQL